MPVDAGDGMVLPSAVVARAGEVQEDLSVLSDLEAFEIPRSTGGGAGAGCDAGVVLGGGDLMLLDGEGLDGDLVYRQLTEGAEFVSHHEGAAFDVNEGRWLERRLRPLGLPRRLGRGLGRDGWWSSSRRTARGHEDAKQRDRGEPQGGVDVRRSEHGVSIVLLKGPMGTDRLPLPQRLLARGASSGRPNLSSR